MRFAVDAGTHVMKIRSPQMTGDEWPSPGNSIFQLKSFSPNFTGKFGALPSPEPFAPRNRVHSCACAVVGERQQTPTKMAAKKKCKREERMGIAISATARFAVKRTQPSF